MIGSSLLANFAQADERRHRREQQKQDRIDEAGRRLEALELVG
jgi:hypothetical protein